MTHEANIYREESGGRNGVGWRSRVQLGGLVHLGYFADAHYGGPDESRAAATAFVDKYKRAVREALPLVRMFQRRNNNVSGIVGVCRRQSLACWVARWTENGESRQKSFRVSRYGEVQAKALAVAARQRAEVEAKERLRVLIAEVELLEQQAQTIFPGTRWNDELGSKYLRHLADAV